MAFYRRSEVVRGGVAHVGVIPADEVGLDGGCGRRGVDEVEGILQMHKRDVHELIGLIHGEVFAWVWRRCPSPATGRRARGGLGGRSRHRGRAAWRGGRQGSSRGVKALVGELICSAAAAEGDGRCTGQPLCWSAARH